MKSSHKPKSRWEVVQTSILSGFDETMRQLPVLVGLTFFALLVSIGSSIVSDQLAEVGRHDFSNGIRILSWILSTILSIGMLNVGLKIYDHKPITFDDLFARGEVFFEYIVTTFLTSVVAIIGLILFLIPGIILTFRLQFAGVLVVDQQLNPLEALAKSWRLTKGWVWPLIGFNLLSFAIVILGIVLAFVGVLVAIPVVIIANIFIYRYLLQHSENRSS